MIEKDKQYVFKLMLGEISQKDIYDYIHEHPLLLKKYQLHGFKLSKKDKTNLDHRIKILVDNCNKIMVNNLFLCWYDSHENYKDILDNYFFSETYKEKKEIENKGSEDCYIYDDEIFELLIKKLSLNKVNLLYFLYLSPIKFTRIQKSEIRKSYYDLSQNNKKSASEKIQLNDEKHEEEEKLKRENNKLINRMLQIEENLKHEKVKCKSIQRKIKELEKSNYDLKKENKNISDSKSKLQEYEHLNKALTSQLNELEHTLKTERKSEYNKYLDEQMKEIEKDVKIKMNNHNKKVIELENKIKRLTMTKSDLLNLIEKKRSELEEYLINGERWYEAFRPQEINNESLDADLDTVIIRINIQEKLKHLKSRFLYSDESFLKKFKKNVFTLYGDSSDITAERFYRKKGFFRKHPHPYSFKEFLEIAADYPKCCFALVIYNANRAPIECYFSNIISSINNDSCVIIDNKFVKIPENILFFFQLDDDEYSAKLSDRLKMIIKNSSNGDSNESY